ncbi:TIGR01548 family HAD hydrolase [Aphanomyces invadans]|uniref:Imidazoleglycerol-phosphate dehydratase n=1 Tax=Aphanomyces invadans TaxID=157072 RepID=A0A024TCM6_9STRA|nr:TIGR01548 family HAD hydrolase [Aphanomyces invadans]ETV91803.1 TIGR01548 family HAD hydrolase [Aphanomyces invadans]|eukprot:XP_008879440.1 TIGR01548 family HAD hydrolase [Aphanomyces invadans]
MASSVTPLKALLWDMDGVLAEVSRSYRAAIVSTAARFGVTVTHVDIDDAKLAGNANNDWVLTHRLITSKSVEVTLEQVTVAFEEIYQGTDGTPGLYRLETLLPSKGLLEELHRRLPNGMAVVTGRPKKDCIKFLKDFELEDLFPTMICMEDAPPKPSPAPIVLALKALGVAPSEAAMLGDTVDDIVAAAQAHVAAIGVLTPQVYAKSILENAEPSITPKLIASGATRVLRPGCDELLDIVRPPNTAVVTDTAHFFTGARVSCVTRKTKETSIQVQLNLDGSGQCEVNTGIGFLDHMLDAVAKHARFNLVLVCKGDTWIDDHHTVEDCGLAFGEAFDKALGKRQGIARFGSALVPLDEALAQVVVDISSRASSWIELKLVRPNIGTLSTEMIPHFFVSFASSARLTLHADVLKGSNDHHKSEAAFKAFARALRQAVAVDATAGVPSTKGLLV